MKACYRIGIVLAWTCYFILSGVMASSIYAMDLIDRAHPRDTNVVYYNLTPPGDKGNYIKQFSAFGPEYGNDVEMLSKSSLDGYESQLTEINKWTGKDGVKVYVLLINGLSTSHYNTVPEEVNDVSKVLEWSKNKKTIQSNFNVELEKEGKKIIEQIAAQQASIINSPAVFCSLIAFEVKYGKDSPGKYQSKKVILYHSTAYGFSDKDNYLKALDASIASSAKANGSLDADANMDLLIKNIRIAVQADIAAIVDETSLLSLKEKLYATHDKLSMSRCIDTLSKSMLSSFDNPLRAHVIQVLLKYDEMSGTATGGMPAFSNVHSAGENVITVMDNVDDINLDSWYTYINTPNGSGQTIIQFIVRAIPRGIIVKTDYDAFTQMINRQIVHYKDFNIKKNELLGLDDKADHVIVWDKSYALKIYSIPPINTNKYEVEFDPTGKIKLTKSKVKEWECYGKSDPYAGTGYAQSGETCRPQWEEEAPMLLDPFELIAFVNRSDFSLLSSKDAITDSVIIMPAMHLMYAKEKKIIKIIQDGISIGLSIATVVSPISEIKYGSMLAQRIIYGTKVSGKISAYMKLSANLGFGGEDFKDISKAYTVIQSFTSVGVKGYGYANTKALKDLANFVYAVYQLKKELSSKSTQSDEVSYVLDLADIIDREAKALKGSDWVEKYRSTSDTGQ